MTGFVQTIHSSASPVTISVPHSGNLLSGHDLPLPPRGGRAVTHRDAATWEIARDVATGVGTSLVRGLLHRSRCDYNRPAPVPAMRVRPAETADWAFDSPAVMPFWLAYHRQVTESLLAARAQGMAPLLIDLHGFATRNAPEQFRRYDIILGTGNRTTVFSSVDRLLAEHLRDLGYTVFLPREQPCRPGGDYLSGRYTIRSIAAGFGIDALQVEISDRFRTHDSKTQGEQLATDLGKFLANL